MLVAWQHGRDFGGHLASCVIMSCLANRQRLGWGSWLDIIQSLPKYAAITEMPTGFPSVWEPNFVRLLHEVESIYDGAKDYAKSAVYWFDSAKPVTNPWFSEKILGEKDIHPCVCDMNSLRCMR